MNADDKVPVYLTIKESRAVGAVKRLIARLAIIRRALDS